MKTAQSRSKNNEKFVDVGAGFKPALGRSQACPGFTIIEMVISLAILAVIIVPLSLAMRTFLFLPSQGVDEYDVMNSLRHAAQIISTDARQAETFTQGSNPNYATFAWVDYIDPAQPAYNARYYYSPVDKRLLRDLTADMSTSTLIILENVDSYSGISVTSSGGVLTVSLTATVSGVTRTFATTEDLKTKLRPTLPVTPSTPSPLTIAWDDFESGDFSEGAGWLSAWTTSGLSSVVATGFPQQGNFHMLLESSTGLASRNLNLSGQANVRVQFWAKASNFGSGDTATFQVSPNGTIWTVVRTWTIADSDNVYHYEDISISSFSMTSNFWIRYQANMTNASNDFYVDSLYVVRGY